MATEKITLHLPPGVDKLDGEILLSTLLNQYVSRAQERIDKDQALSSDYTTARIASYFLGQV